MSQFNRELGRDFLEGRLSREQESTLASHRDHCTQCANWLEQDAGDTRTWHMASELAAVSQPSASVAHDADPNGGGEAYTARALLPWLAPSEDPAMLGRVGLYEISGVIGRGGQRIVASRPKALVAMTFVAATRRRVRHADDPPKERCAGW